MASPGSRKKYALLVAAIASLPSCASLSHESRNQYVLVRSEPSGVPIYSEGRKVGTTPAYVEVSRSRHPEIELRTKEESRKVAVPTAYDWNRSFLGNFAFLVAAPAGWLVDLGVGSAWKLSDPPPARISASPGEVVRKQPVVAVAPPASESMTTSDAVAVLWEKRLEKQFPGARFLPYEETLPVFTSHGYDFDNEPSYDDMHRISGLLGAGLIFESNIEETKKGITLDGKFRDVYNGQKSSEHVLEVAPQKEGGKASWYEGWKDWYYLIPNTVGIEWSNAQLSLASGSSTFDSQFPSRSSFGDKALNLLDSVSFTHLDPPRHEAASRFLISLTPDFRFSYREIEFPGIPAFLGTRFYYLVLSLGLGPEVGWQSGPHYVYVNFTPAFGLNQLSWSGGGRHSVGAFSLAGELGYLYFFTQAMSVRLFASSVFSSNTADWNAALQNLSPGSAPISSVTENVFGVAFGYTFQPERRISDWKAEGRAPAF